MAVFVPFPSGCQVEIVYNLAGRIVENRLWFYTADGPPDFAAVQGLADGVLAWHVAYILPFLSADLVLVDVEASDWSTDPTTIFAVAPANLNGGVAEPSYSANVAVVVAFRWALQAARQRKNKHFIPGIPDGAVTQNTVEPFFQDAMFEAYSALIDAARTWFPGNYWYWVVTSAIDASMPRSEMFFTQAIGAVARPKIILGQRRKRLPP